MFRIMAALNGFRNTDKPFSEYLGREDPERNAKVVGLRLRSQNRIHTKVSVCKCMSSVYGS
jgi:hypothetical protein